MTPLGATLQTGAPGAARATVLTMASPWAWGAFGELQYSLETGEPSIEKVLGMGLFEHLAAHPEEAAQFSESMVGIHGAEPPAVAAAYDFSAYRSIVDVGGATGNMLAAILSAHPAAHGVLFDRPHVVTEAPALLRARGVEGRVSIAEGSFFEHVPAGGDLYILSHIIHDWTEAQCLTILGNCRAGDEAGREAADRGVRAAGRQHAAFRQADRHGDADDTRAVRNEPPPNTTRSSPPPASR